MDSGQVAQMWANQLPMALLFITEVKDAVFENNSRKAPGVDGFPASVWQQLWPIIQNEVYCLFKRSLEERIADLEDRQDHLLAQTEGITQYQTLTNQPRSGVQPLTL